MPSLRFSGVFRRRRGALRSREFAAKARRLAFPFAAGLLTPFTPSALFFAAGLLALSPSLSSSAPRVPPPPGVRFTDVSSSCGVDFRHDSGASGTKYAVEVLGSGGALLDFDVDGDLDLYLVNGGALPGAKQSAPPQNALFENLGKLQFRRVPGAAGATPPHGNSQGTYGMGSAVGDVDNDGDPDLYVTNFGPNRLYRNDGGKFVDVTAKAGVGDPRWSTSAAFFDMEGDGDLDLYVCNYFKYRLETHGWYGLRKPGYRTHGGPASFSPEEDVLYRNRGDGTFEDVSRACGILNVPVTHSLGVVAGDFDEDKDIDLFVANDTQENFLFVNDGAGRFTNDGVLAGVAYDRNGKPQASMGVDAGDADGDGRFDLLCTNFSHETNALYRSEGGGFFTDISMESGLGEPSLPFLGFGCGFFDLENDRDLDVFVANGHIMDNVPLYFDDLTFAMRNQLFVNGGKGQFAEADSSWGPIVSRVSVSRAAIFGDLDNDGDTDLVVTNKDEGPQILRNDGGHGAGWVRVILEGTKSNRDGFGATVTLTAGGKTRVAAARASFSYLASNDPRLLFGLGGNSQASKIEVVWPSGLKSRVDNIASGREIRIREGAK